MNWKLAIKILGNVLGVFVKVISPEIRKILCDFIVALYQKALATLNPWDDMLVEILAEAFDVNLPEP